MTAAAVLSGAWRLPMRVVERRAVGASHHWLWFVSGVAEPALQLGSIGLGVGGLVGEVEVAGRLVSYAAFVAPALLASSAMNAAIFDLTIDMFIRFKYLKAYTAMLNSPLSVRELAQGELLWSLVRTAVYAAVFLVAMVALGLTRSGWAVLCVPAAVLVAYGFGGVGTLMTTLLRSWVDFDRLTLVLVPSFLFSATFFPLSVYPDWLRVVVQATPLYQGVALERALALGTPGWADLGHAVYLVVLGAVTFAIGSRRLRHTMTP